MTDIVRIRNVAKRFVVHKDKSLKERLVNARSSRAHREDFWALRDIDLDVRVGRRSVSSAPTAQASPPC